MAGIEEIFKKYKNKVYRLAISITRNEKDSEDVSQNVFIKIINNINKFRGNSSVSTWIYRITYNEALMHLRKRRSQREVYETIPDDEDAPKADLFINWAKLPDKELLDKELRERLDNSIRQMDIKYRMPLLLHNVEGLPIKTVVSVLGIKENTVKTRLYRPRDMLKSEISDYFKDKDGKEPAQAPKCGLWTDFVYKYAAEGLNKEKKASFDRHIEDCNECKSFFSAYTKAIRITNALACSDIPVGLQKKIETFLLNESSN